MKKRCRKRERVEYDQHPEMGAFYLLAAASNRILRQYGEIDPKAEFGSFMSKADMEGLALLNHCMSYLTDRQEYETEVRPQLYGYLRIT